MRPVVVCLASAILWLPSTALAASPAGGHSIAVLPATGGGVSAAVLDAVDVALESLALLVPGVETVADEGLRGALGRDPRAALTDCGVELECLAALGRKAGTAEVLLARLAATPTGFDLELSVIGADDGSVRRSLTVHLAGAGGVEAALQGHEQTLFRGAGDGDRATAAEVEPVAAGDVWQGAALGSSTRTPAGHTVEVKPKVVEVQAAPTSEPPPAPVETAAVPLPPAAPALPEPLGEPIRPLLLAGIGAAVIAIAATAVGSVFASRYRGARADIDAAGAKTTSQPEALRLAREANDARPWAIAGLATGGVAAFAAAGLFAWTRFDRGPVQVSVQPEPRGASLRLDW